MKYIVVLGATGSLGQATLEVIGKNRDRFQVVGISGKTKRSLLKNLGAEFNVENISNGSPESLVKLATIPEVDIVINALSGEIGVAPTYAALRAGKNVALANKESLVSAGPVLLEEARKNNAKIIPIDSELSALHQILDSRPSRDIEKIIITASGGPFLGLQRKALQHVTVEDALKHPTWKMGPKITIDSATLMNKALEMIEACYLFNVSPDQIEITIHRESIIHALVQFRDGNIMAVLSPADMRFAIHYALFYPERVPNNFQRLDLTMLQALHFEKPDFEIFKGSLLAKEALCQAGDAPALLSQANEIAVQKFLNREISFLEIYDFIEQYICLCKNRSKKSKKSKLPMMTEGSRMRS